MNGTHNGLILTGINVLHIISFCGVDIVKCEQDKPNPTYFSGVANKKKSTRRCRNIPEHKTRYFLKANLVSEYLLTVNHEPR